MLRNLISLSLSFRRARMVVAFVSLVAFLLPGMQVFTQDTPAAEFDSAVSVRQVQMDAAGEVLQEPLSLLFRCEQPLLEFAATEGREPEGTAFKRGLWLPESLAKLLGVAAASEPDSVLPADLFTRAEEAGQVLAVDAVTCEEPDAAGVQRYRVELEAVDAAAPASVNPASTDPAPADPASADRTPGETASAPLIVTAEELANHLLLLYGAPETVQGNRVRRATLETGYISFNKTVKSDSFQVLDSKPTAAEFSLLLTPLAGGDAITIAHDGEAEVPVGEYVLSEQHRDPATGELTTKNQLWVPEVTTFSPNAYDCKSLFYDRYARKDEQGRWILTVKAGARGACEVTNVSAILGLVTFNVKERLDQTGVYENNTAYSYQLTSADEAAFIPDNFNPQGSNAAQRYISPDKAYGINPTMPMEMAFLRVERCNSFLQSDCMRDSRVKSTRWTRVTGDAPISVAQGKRSLYRVVVKPWSEIALMRFDSELVDQGVDATALGVSPAATADSFGLWALGEQDTSTHTGFEILKDGDRVNDITPGEYQLTWLSRRDPGGAVWDETGDRYYGLTREGLQCENRAGIGPYPEAPGYEDTPGVDMPLSADRKITVPGGGHVFCQARFGLALATLLSFDASEGKYVADSLHSAEVSSDTADALATGTWESANSVGTATTRVLTPQANYTVTGNELTSRATQQAPRLERYTGANPADAAADTGFANWEAVTEMSVYGGEYTVYRLVYGTTYRPELPLTGGLGADAFYLSGSGVLMTGVLVALWRRFRRLRREPVAAEVHLASER